jgi:hypothetical protein
MTGAWESTVIDAARLFGWRVAHFRPALTKHGWRTPVAADGKGWPDLVLVRERVIYAELKSGSGRLTPEQEEWITRLRNAGQEVYVWHDTQLEAVVAILRKRVTP